MTNYATKMLDWEDPNIGFQQQRGQHGEGLTVSHSLVRFIPLPDGALEINFGSTVHFCGGHVVSRFDGEVLLDVQARADLVAALYPIGGPLVSAAMFDEMKARAAKLAAMAPQPFGTGIGDLSRQLHQADQLRVILGTRPGPEGTLAEWQKWDRVAGKLLEEMR